MDAEQLLAELEEIEGDDRAWLHELGIINRNIIRMCRMLVAIGVVEMATDEQVAALTAAVRRVQDSENVTETEVRDVISALQFHQGNTPDPAVAAAITTLGTVADKLATLTTDEAPPAEGSPAEEATETPAFEATEDAPPVAP